MIFIYSKLYWLILFLEIREMKFMEQEIIYNYN